MATDFEIDWNEKRDLVTARMQVGDVEIAAHSHVTKPGRTPSESLDFTRNTGADGQPYVNMGMFLPAGGYRRLAAMLTAIADAADAEAVAKATEPLPLGTGCDACDGGGCNNCLPEPHDPESAPAPAGGIITVLALLVSLALGACHATAPVVAQPETVGTLAPAYASVMSAPVAPSTDLSRGSFVASDADDDGPAVVAGAGEAVAPDVAPKGGLVMGAVR